ncbi:MAG: hypothetical protein WAT22_10660 [Saprospiraceae bacterium]|nr:hypothetical protein [Saprospiraceae bacterium]MBK9567036.1 hypothetical protein [Saprospiraceae bacterium]MBP6446655.1 hypothetical protein [Saprospiraceae bacterium]
MCKCPTEFENRAQSFRFRVGRLKRSVTGSLELATICVGMSLPAFVVRQGLRDEFERSAHPIRFWIGGHLLGMRRPKLSVRST